MSIARGQGRRRAHSTRAVAALVALSVAVVAATAAPTASADQLSQKRAEAKAAAQRLTELQAAAEKKIEAYDAAHQRLQETLRRIHVNEQSLAVAKANLASARERLSASLTETYKSGDQDAIAYLLAARSIGELVDQVQVMQRANGLNKSLLNDVTRYRTEVAKRQVLLDQERKARKRQQAAAAAARDRVLASLHSEQAYYNNLKGSIKRLIAAREAAQQAAAEQTVSTGDTGATGNLPAPPSSTVGGQAVAIAEQYLGVPYVWGGASPSGFDCSGLTMYVYAQLGVSLPHNAAAQYGMLPHVSESDLEPGDLVFFYGLGHVGIYIGGGAFIHAPHPGDVVRISSLSAEGSYYGAARVPG